MAGFMGRLESGETLAAAQYFEGPWRSFSRTTIEPGDERDFAAVDAEYSIFVMSGEGVGRVGTQTHAMNPGTAFTVGFGAKLTLAATDGPVEIFVTTLNVALDPG